MAGISGADTLNDTPLSSLIYGRQVDIFLEIIHSRWSDMGLNVRILDLGCGDGEMVRAMRQRGYLAWGSDLKVPENSEDVFFLPADPSTGRVEAGDGSFDVVISNQVLEHAMDLPAIFREIRRILRPGGVSLHAFPSRWSLLEQHVSVPLGGVFRSRSYLRFWAWVGVRNVFQVGYRPGQVVSLNLNYLWNHAHYPPQRQLCSVISQYFPIFAFIERDFLLSYSNTEGLKKWKRLVIRIMLSLHLEGIYRMFRARALWLEG